MNIFGNMQKMENTLIYDDLWIDSCGIIEFKEVGTCSSRHQKWKYLTSGHARNSMVSIQSEEHLPKSAVPS